MLEVKNLLVFYENALAINDLSFRVDRGQMVGVIGSNSAGKTTLMNTISGLIIDMKIKEARRGGERITVMGDVIFNGETITHMEPYDRAKKGIALCRERHPIFPESDVLENLKIAGYLIKRSELKERIDFVFNLFPALIALKSRRAGFLSGGEQQMLAIGMALIIDHRFPLHSEIGRPDFRIIHQLFSRTGECEHPVFNDISVVDHRKDGPGELFTDDRRDSHLLLNVLNGLD